jgi:hypothetical protein
MAAGTSNENSKSVKTTDPDVIWKWIEKRGGGAIKWGYCVSISGIFRTGFTGTDQPDQTSDGEESRYNKFVSKYWRRPNNLPD